MYNYIVLKDHHVYSNKYVLRFAIKYIMDENYVGGKWGKVMTRGKLIFQFAGFNRQMTPNDKEEKLILLRQLLDRSPFICNAYREVYTTKSFLD